MVKLRPLVRRSRLVAVLGPAALLATACLGYPAEGTVTTPEAPAGSEAQSRLPQLLSQFQGGSSGLSLFDGSTNEVLAEQDATPSGKDSSSLTPVPSQTVAGANTPGPSDTTPGPGNPTPVPTSGSLPQLPGTLTPTPTATPTATPTPSAAAETPTPTATPTGTPTPTAGPPVEESPPTEGGSGSGELPPTETEE